MGSRRRRPAFVPLASGGGTAALGGLGLERTRRLELHAAWRLAVGEGLARRVEPVALHADGTLVVRLLDRDAAWVRTIDGLLPELAGRLATRLPGRRIRRVRREARPGEAEAPAARYARVPVEDAPSGGAAEPARRPVPDPRRLMRAYLARRGGDA